jgi:hypothetical protein
VGTSANALKIQIWTALIALLLVKFLQLRSRFSWHLSRLMALLRQTTSNTQPHLDAPSSGSLTPVL